MAVSFVGAAQASGASVTLPSGIQSGDVIVIYAYRAALVSPTTPSGFTSISAQSNNNNSHRAAYKVAVGTESGTSITATNANVMQASIYRGGSGTLGVSGGTNAASTTTVIPAISTMLNNNGTSWVVTCCGSAQTTSQSTPSGTTIRGTAQTGTGSIALISDSNAGVSSWAQHTSTAGTSAVGAGVSIEIVAATITNTYITYRPPFMS